VTWSPSLFEQVVHTALLSRGTVVLLDEQNSAASVRWDIEPSEVMRHPIDVLRPLDLVERISELPDLRIGTPHEEIVVGDRAYCKVCGPIEHGTADMHWHADSFEEDACS